MTTEVSPTRMWLRYLKWRERTGSDLHIGCPTDWAEFERSLVEPRPGTAAPTPRRRS